MIVRSLSRAGAQRGEHAAQDPERHDDHEREERELQRADERVPDEISDRRRVLVRGAEVAGHHATRPVEVALRDRVVHAELLVQQVDGPLVRERAEDRAARVAGQELRRREDDDAEQDERDRREGEALEDECGDRGLLGGVWWRRRRRHHTGPPSRARPRAG